MFAVRSLSIARTQRAWQLGKPLEKRVMEVSDSRSLALCACVRKIVVWWKNRILFVGPCSRASGRLCSGTMCEGRVVDLYFMRCALCKCCDASSVCFDGEWAIACV